jgi:hypothetical protein
LVEHRGFDEEFSQLMQHEGYDLDKFTALMKVVKKTPVEAPIPGCRPKSAFPARESRKNAVKKQAENEQQAEQEQALKKQAENEQQAEQEQALKKQAVKDQAEKELAQALKKQDQAEKERAEQDQALKKQAEKELAQQQQWDQWPTAQQRYQAKLQAHQLYQAEQQAQQQYQAELQAQQLHQAEQHNQQMLWDISEEQRLAAEGYQRCKRDWGKRSLGRYRDGVQSGSKTATNFNIKNLLPIAIPKV